MANSSVGVPEILSVESEGKENDFILRVTWAKRLIVIVDNRDRVLRRGHKKDSVRQDFSADSSG